MSDGSIVCEAEEFRVEKPGGWQAQNWGSNYYAATFSNTPAGWRRQFYGDLAAAWSDDRQVLLEVTPEYGRVIWSGCSWLTFRARLDPSFSGKTIDVLALNLSIEGVGLEMSKAYLLEDTP